MAGRGRRDRALADSIFTGSQPLTVASHRSGRQVQPIMYLHGEALSPGAAAYRVLVIEDDAAISRVLQLELEHEGYDVEVARDGLAGLEKALKEPDLVILDLMLPRMDGIEVCKRIRAKSRVPIIMLTARDRVPDRVAGLDVGADDYVTKPFSTEELLARVRARLRERVPQATSSNIATSSWTATVTKSIAAEKPICAHRQRVRAAGVSAAAPQQSAHARRTL